MDVQKGIGLGLTICESIIRQHGGRMEAHNRTDGRGAEFVFTLPLKETVTEKDAPDSGEEDNDGAVS